jgi:hypothetical protein
MIFAVLGPFALYALTENLGNLSTLQQTFVGVAAIGIIPTSRCSERHI